MKPSLTILIEGYAYPGEDERYFATPSTILLRFKGCNYLVDPGCNAPLLLEKLRLLQLAPSDVSAIFLTHYHLDHTLNIRLFPDTPLYDGIMRWENDLEEPHKDYWIHKEFQMLATPGHAQEEYSLLIDTAEHGIVSISQDVFWWEDGKQDTTSRDILINQPDPFMIDFEALKESRRKVLDSGAKWIIPGHGKMFENNFRK